MVQSSPVVCVFRDATSSHPKTSRSLSRAFSIRKRPVTSTAPCTLRTVALSFDSATAPAEKTRGSRGRASCDRARNQIAQPCLLPAVAARTMYRTVSLTIATCSPAVAEWTGLLERFCANAPAAHSESGPISFRRPVFRLLCRRPSRCLRWLGERQWPTRGH